MQYNISFREKDNSWQYIISYKDNSGKWKQKGKQGFPLNRMGKQAAKDAADEALKELKLKLMMEAEVNVEYEGITFKEYADIYIKRERLYKEGNTINSYLTAVKKFEKLHDLELTILSKADIQECIDDLIREGLNGRSIKTYYWKIKIILNSAIEDSIITKNLTEKIVIPTEKKKTEKRALTQYELDDLLSKIKNRNHYIISVLAGKCGLRRGEILGLTWDDIDLENLKITIKQQLKIDKTGSIEIGELKSKNSNRVVPISSKIVSILNKFKQENPINKDRRLFVYKNPIGISSGLIKSFKQAGYDISLHELRHTYTTLLIANGIDLKTVAKLLGHDVEETYRTYSHFTDEMMDKAAERIKAIF